MQALYQTAEPVNSTPETPKPNRQPRVSEIFLASDDSGMTLAMIAHLSHQYKVDGRWLTWICTTQISKQALADYNFDLRGLRILLPKTPKHISELMIKALETGTSHSVVAHYQGQNQERSRLEQAASTGRCNGLVIRSSCGDNNSVAHSTSHW